MRLYIRKLTPLALAVGTAVGGSLLVGGAAASADPGGGAVVIKEFFCSAILPDGTFLITNEKTHTVITPSGNAKLTCHFEGPPVAETVNQEGFLCNTFVGDTTNSHFVYTKSGQGTLTCQVKSPS